MKFVNILVGDKQFMTPVFRVARLKIYSFPRKKGSEEKFLGQNTATAWDSFRRAWKMSQKTFSFRGPATRRLIHKNLTVRNMATPLAIASQR